MTIMNKTTLPTIIANNYLVIAKVMLGVAALFAGSQIVIPIQPVPISMQTVVICIIAVTYAQDLVLLRF
jgi:biotin transport system substrate-specific component